VVSPTSLSTLFFDFVLLMGFVVERERERETSILERHGAKTSQAFNNQRHPIKLI